MQIWKLILLLVLALAAGSSATSDSTSAPSESTEHYLQAVVWEQHMIFNNVLEWAVQKGVLTPSQFGTIQSELAKRLEDVSENEGTDVLGMPPKELARHPSRCSTRGRLAKSGQNGHVCWECLASHYSSLLTDF